MSSLSIQLPGSQNWLRRNFVTIIAMVAFLFMALLNVQQGRIIESQRVLIQQIFGDTLALNSVLAHQIEQRHQAERDTGRPNLAAPRH